MSYRFYPGSRLAWAAMFEQLEKANKTIYWESFIFENNLKEYDFLNLLIKKAEVGVKVKMIVDSFGGLGFGREDVFRLRGAGIEILFYNRLLPWWNPYRFKHWFWHRNHRKLLIIDEKVAFLGGVNVGKRFADWLDLHAMVKGLLVRYLIRDFAVSYQLCGGLQKIKYKTVFKGNKVKVFQHSPLTQRGVLKKFYKEVLKRAKREVFIVTPYFFPQPWFIAAINRALKRGVKIKIIVPKKTDSIITDLANYIFISLIWQKGLEFYLCRKMNHAKAILVDGEIGSIGSQNIDTLSFDYNLESGLIFERKDLLVKLRGVFELFMAESEPLVELNRNNSIGHRLLKLVVLSFRNYL